MNCPKIHYIKDTIYVPIVHQSRKAYERNNNRRTKLVDLSFTDIPSILFEKIEENKAANESIDAILEHIIDQANMMKKDTSYCENQFKE